MIALVIGGGFDTTTALTAHALEWLSEHPDERERLRPGARHAARLGDRGVPALLHPGARGRAHDRRDCEIAGTQFKEGERLWLSWAMANRDPEVFPDPNEIDLDRPATGTPASAWASTAASAPTWPGWCSRRCHRRARPDARLRLRPRRAGALRDDRRHQRHAAPAGHLHPRPRLGAGLDETLATLQKVCDEQRLAEPVTEYKEAAVIGD